MNPSSFACANFAVAGGERQAARGEFTLTLALSHLATSSRPRRQGRGNITGLPAFAAEDQAQAAQGQERQRGRFGDTPSVHHHLIDIGRILRESD